MSTRNSVDIRSTRPSKNSVFSPDPTNRSTMNSTLFNEDLLAIHNLSATYNADDQNYGGDLRSNDKAMLERTFRVDTHHRVKLARIEAQEEEEKDNETMVSFIAILNRFNDT